MTGIIFSESFSKKKSKSDSKILLNFLILSPQDFSLSDPLTKNKKMLSLWPALSKVDLFPNSSNPNPFKWELSWENHLLTMLWNGKKLSLFLSVQVLPPSEATFNKNKSSWNEAKTDNKSLTQKWHYSSAASVQMAISFTNNKSKAGFRNK